MKLMLFATCCALLIYTAHGSSDKCIDTNQYCDSTNYQSYVECVRKRQKRSTDCNTDCEGGNCVQVCQSCDCSSCNYASCQSGCNSCCNSCCNNYVPCTTNHCCHKTCHAQCSTSTCRSSCRQNCFNNVEKNTRVIVEGSGGGSISTSNNTVNTGIRHNVTTVIHLNNVINNTNVIDIPINLNSTNVQNVTLTEGSPSYQVNPGQVPSSPVGPSGEPCCTVIGPKQCVSKPKPHCFHLRSQQCGPFCTSSIVHKEQEQICESMYPGAPNICKQQVMYIPQPQPRCAYQAEWPYVRCGVQKSQACGGCYEHYVDSRSSAYLGCPYQCYDDGFSNGPLYRRGPVYRPMYSHMPYGMNQYPYGGMGMPNPVYGMYGNGMYGNGLQQVYPAYPGGDFMQDQSNMNASGPLMMEPMINVGAGFGQDLPVPYYPEKEVDIVVDTEYPDRGARDTKWETTTQSDKSGRDKRTPEKSVNVTTTTLPSTKLS